MCFPFQSDAQKTLLPKIVGTDRTPETECNFILWVSTTRTQLEHNEIIQYIDVICLQCYYRQAKKEKKNVFVTALKCFFIEFLLQTNKDL